MEANEILTWVNVAIGVIILVAPLIAAIVGLTSWGKNHKDALDTVVDVVGQMKRAQLPATELPRLMKLKATDPTTRRGVVNTWKKARARRDPKGG